MFFSDDLLSSKKGSFGIIWLAATLGPKTKRITRKQLTAVDLTRTCELIAEPPEPLALRLSGCLLVGVARVYNQNYDLFYTDVTKFHSDLRRMVLTDFGAPTGPGGQPAGLDLAGDGKARIDQITFDGEDVSWLSNLNADFLNMRWQHPKFASRHRQASSQLSSLASQNTDGQVRDRGEYNSEEESEDEEDDGDGEIPRRLSNKRRNTDGTTGSNKKPRAPRFPIPDPTSDFEPLIMDEELFPGIFDVPDGPNDTSLIEPSEVPFDFQPDINVDNGMNGLTTPRQGSEVGGEVRGEDQPGAKPQHGSLASLEEVEGAIEPVKKKKQVKKAKKVKFDNDLEIEYDALRDVSYAQRMTEERAETRMRDRNKFVDERAAVLVDGAGNWVNFFDPEMKDLFATCGRPDKFKWEKDDIVNGPKYHEASDRGAGVEDHINLDQGHNPDPFVDNDITGETVPYVDAYVEYDVTIPNEGEPEVPRDPSQRSLQESQLPWAHQAFPDSDDDDILPQGGFTPGSRLSGMTPLERKIRMSSGRDSMGGRKRQERSPSVLANRSIVDPAQLVSDVDANDFDINDELFDPNRLPASQMRRELPDAFQPHMLASLETQCRDFMAFTERRMFEQEKEELDFHEIIEEDSSKKVAALAFYNCLTLATKRIISISQPDPWGSITLSFNAEL